MTPITNWYRKLPRPAQVASRYALAIVLTIATLTVYHLLAHPDHPYLIGLFPVIAAAIIAGPGPGMVSLVISAIYIDLVVTKTAPGNSSLFVVVFLVEGTVLLWMVRQRQHARQLLSATLAQREMELAKLRKVHDQLQADATRRDQSIEQIHDSNQIMVKTLERILDEHRNT